MKTIVMLSAGMLFSAAVAAQCDGPLQGEMKKLRSDETVDLCELRDDNVVLVVNTASQCGYVGQFEGLEQLYQTYKDRGFTVVGFPSDSFSQEYSDETATAETCYVNYGVTFPMMATSYVDGPEVNPVFAELNRRHGEPPQWNFYKYLLDSQGNIVEVYPSTVRPDDQGLQAAIEQQLDSAKRANR